jgi:iron(III) transport system substrate-binding protein
MEAFQKRFNLKLDWEWIPLTSSVSGPRIAEQAKAKVRLPSVVGGYPYVLFDHWIDKNGLAARVDWLGTFGTELPGIRAAAMTGVLTPWQGALLRQWDVIYVMVYNTSLLKRQDVPDTAEALTDAKWRGRFAMSSVSSVPLEYFALTTGPDAALDLTRRLMANQPRYKPGPPAVVGAVVNGEVPIAIGGYTALADAQKANGAPVDWKPMNVVPVQPLFAFVLKDSPQPNLGRLFVAWLVSEGATLQDQVEFLARAGDPASSAAKKLKEMGAGTQFVESKNTEEEKIVSKTSLDIMNMLSQGGRK